jgi:ribosome-binding protein aMBF1 (putative translation factor)
MGDAVSAASEFGSEALVRRLGSLAKQRREEYGHNRISLAKEAGIEPDETIEDFEFGRNLPPEDTRRKLEEALSWKVGAIDEAMRMANRPAGT